MSNIALLLTFFIEGLIWFIIFFLCWCAFFLIRLTFLHVSRSKYQCPPDGCLGCKYLDLSLSKVDGATWHCMLGREAKNPFRH